MGDVDFINENKKTEEDEENSKTKNKEEDTVEWTRKEGAKEAPAASKKDAAASGTKNSEKEKTEILSWIKGLKDKQDSNFSAKELKKSRSAVAEYQDRLKKEGKSREIKKGIISQKKGLGGFSGLSSIGQMIKDKLSNIGGDDVIKTNLIKTESVTYFNWKKNLSLFVFSICSVCAVIGILYIILDSREKQIKQETAGLVEEIGMLKGKISNTEKEVVEVDDFQKRIKLVNSMLEDHVYWSNFFDFLESVLLTDSYLTSDFSAKISGEFSFVVRTKDFRSLTDQVRVLRKNPFVKEVIVNSGAIVKDDATGLNLVNYTLGVKISPIIFYKNKKEGVVKMKAEKYDLGYKDLNGQKIDPEVLKIISKSTSETKKVVAFEKSEKNLKVGLVDPERLNDITKTLKNVEDKEGLKAQYFLISEDSYQHAISQYE